MRLCIECKFYSASDGDGKCTHASGTSPVDGSPLPAIDNRSVGACGSEGRFWASKREINYPEPPDGDE